MRLLLLICNDFDSFGSAKQILALQSGKVAIVADGVIVLRRLYDSLY